MPGKLNCIMVIDDDEPTNFISTMVLEELDCAARVLVFETGEKALHHLSQSTIAGSADQLPELIFLDINMPCMNGWEFLEAFRQLDPYSCVYPVIIMLTTSQNPDDQLRAQQVRAVAGFETKPITAEMVNRLLETHFEKAGHDRTMPHTTSISTQSLNINPISKRSL